MKNLIVSTACFIAFIAMASGRLQNIVPFATIESEIAVAVLLLGVSGVTMAHTFNDLKRISKS